MNPASHAPAGPTLFTGIQTLVTMVPAQAACADTQPRSLGAILDAALLVQDGRVLEVGPRATLEARTPTQVPRQPLQAPLVLPGLVDCHTHLVFAGNRLADFEARCSGVGYQEIARRGGGIASTVRATRAASVEDLTSLARDRLQHLLAQGVTCVEAKSGYGLSTESELRLLEVCRRLPDHFGHNVRCTFLGAHVVPPEHRADPETYIQIVLQEMLPEVARRGLADFADVFVEEGAFSPAQARRILQRARSLGLGLKVHAEQMGPSGGCALAAELGAISADHLDYAGPAEARLLADAGVVPVFLPAATLFLGHRNFPAAKAFLDVGLSPALSTDYNPGSAMSPNLLLTGTLGCVQCGMTPEQALGAVTIRAAAAMGVEDSGILAPGSRADFVVADSPDWRQLFYHFAVCPVERTFILGRCVWKRSWEVGFNEDPGPASQAQGGRPGTGARG
jgi:imidazolonepropionase